MWLIMDKEAHMQLGNDIINTTDFPADKPEVS